VLSATFERPLDTGRPGNDVKFAFGSPYHINVAHRQEDDDWTKKHTFRAWSDEAIELFTAGAAEPGTLAPTTGDVAAPTAAPGGDPCSVADGKFTNAVNLLLASDPVTLDVKGDCATKTLELTVTGKSTGWLAVGFAPNAGEMNGADTYQVRINDQGKAEVRNGFTDEYDVLEDELIAGATGSRDGDKITVTFKRPFVSTRGERDATLGFGKKFFIHVAKSTNNDFATKHGPKVGGQKATDIFFIAAPPGTGNGAVTDGPCKSKSSFSNKYTQTVTGGDVKVSYTVRCEEGTIEFGLSSNFKDPAAAWLALGFADSEGKMPGSDTYQVRVSKDGKAQVRYGKAEGKTIDEEKVADASGGKEDDGDLDVKFVRPIKPASDKDVDLSFGKQYWFNVARRDSDNEWGNKHTSKAWSPKKIDLWTEGDLIDDVAAAATPAAAMVASAALAMAALLIVM
jgi:hypothetical protein